VVLIRRRAVFDGEATGLLLERDEVRSVYISSLPQESSRGMAYLHPRPALTMGGVFHPQHKTDCCPPACALWVWASGGAFDACSLLLCTWVAGAFSRFGHVEVGGIRFGSESTMFVDLD
jgi:hypothetical protein